MPRITVAPHTPALASDFNTVSDQSLMRFASAPQRSAAIPTPTKGMHTFRDDVNAVETWNGTEWQWIPPAAVGAQPLIITTRRTATAVPGTGGQFYITFAGFYSVYGGEQPTVIVQAESQFAIRWHLLGYNNSSQIAVQMRLTNAGDAPAADGTQCAGSIMMVGRVAVAGVMPTFTN